MFVFDKTGVDLYSSALVFLDVTNWNILTMYEDNEMILTEENLDKAAKFIGASSYEKADRLVTFFNVPAKIFNDVKTKSDNSFLSDGVFEFVSIYIGNFIFVK